MWGVLAAVLSSGIGGTAVVATRALSGMIDPISLGALRFGLGFLFLLPVAALQKEAWPAKMDWPRVAGLGVLFFAVFPFFFNASLHFTTAARGALALSTLPLLTMVVGAGLGVEAITARKTLGVLIAMAGVALALLSGLANAPEGAWQGDLLMVCAALCMALYTIWSRPLILRSGPIRFTAVAMGVGAFCLVAISAADGGLSRTSALAPGQWLACCYLGIVGSAFIFFLWAFAITRTTPTLVAISVAVNPIMASLAGQVFLDEPLRWNIIAGLITVCTGIGIATTAARMPART
ncbi:DMT family transporter [Labrys okinawensis]|uniref:DMT family transporter n=1 Tax=Labrys okinawensis TaxID=346911 RepID=UPI0039BCA72E